MSDGAHTGRQAVARVPTVGFGTAWRQAFPNRASGLSLDEAQTVRTVSGQPTHWEVEQAASILDMTL